MKSALRQVERGEPDWPGEFDVIEHPPERVWCRGRWGLLAVRPRVAIVGSRGPSPYGEDQARRFAGALAGRGVVVVSGLARGIDAAAHAAALEVGGSTIAVLGSGVDRPWPGGPLADRMTAEGLLLAEYEPGTPPARHHFPMRNRLIAALAGVVVVIEAAYRSGSLITARWGADQGKEVLALPGRVDQPLARGCHRLLREGAGLVEDPGEVIELLGLEVGAAPTPTDESESPMLAALLGETATAAELSDRTGRSLPAVLAELARLELEGRVARAPGGLYRRREVLR